MMLLSIFCVLVVCQTEVTRLPEFNCWELSRQLLMYEDLRDQLDVSPQQLEEIKVLHSSKELHALYASKKRALSQAGNSFRGNTLVWSALDDRVLEELRKILTEKQIEGLRVLTMRRAFPNGSSPFSKSFFSTSFDAKPIATHCQFSENDVRIIESVFAQREAECSAAILQSRLESGIRVLDKLPIHARELFVDYAGNKYYPELPVKSRAIIDSVHTPFFREEVFVAFFDRYIGSTDLREVMTSAEQKRAEEIEE